IGKAGDGGATEELGTGEGGGRGSGVVNAAVDAPGIDNTGGEGPFDNAFDVLNGDRVDDALDYDINGVDFACGGGVFDHRGDRVEEGGSRRCISCNGMGPANEFLFLEEGQG